MGKNYYVLMDDRVTYRKVAGLTWAQWLLDAGSHRLVALGHVGDSIVSTEFIGVCQDSEQPPLPWQTMIIGGERHGYRCSYANAEQARQGHQAVVDELEAAQARRHTNGKATPH